MKFFGQNRHFLANYRGYVNKEWAGYYFSYDFFKAEYKKLKGHDRLEKDLEDLDNKLLAEIQRVHKFLALMVQSVGADIDSVATIVDKLEISPTKSAEQADQIDRSVEISLRSLYEKINQCDEFFQLNHFVISKTTKKMEKLLAQQEKGTVSVWGGYSSGRFFYDDFSSSGPQIQEIQRKCVDVYTVKFRKKYSQLAKYELKYAKNKDDDHKQTRFYIGAKLGLAIAVVSPSPYTPICPLSPLSLPADLLDHAGLQLHAQRAGLLAAAGAVRVHDHRQPAALSPGLGRTDIHMVALRGQLHLRAQPQHHPAQPRVSGESDVHAAAAVLVQPAHVLQVQLPG